MANPWLLGWPDQAGQSARILRPAGRKSNRRFLRHFAQPVQPNLSGLRCARPSRLIARTGRRAGRGETKKPGFRPASVYENKVFNLCVAGAAPQTYANFTHTDHCVSHHQHEKHTPSPISRQSPVLVTARREGPPPGNRPVSAGEWRAEPPSGRGRHGAPALPPKDGEAVKKKVKKRVDNIHFVIQSDMETQCANNIAL